MGLAKVDVVGLGIRPGLVESQGLPLQEQSRPMGWLAPLPAPWLQRLKPFRKG